MSNIESITIQGALAALMTMISYYCGIVAVPIIVLIAVMIIDYVTGMVAACLLRLCGVSDDDIVADYCQTEIYNAAVIERQIKSLPDAIRESISPQSMEAAMSSKAPTMRSYLSWLDEHDLARCLDEQGFSYGQQQLLAERMCAAPDA